MKKADYDGIIALLGNPDTVADGLVQLSEKLTTDENEFNSLNASVNTLRDTNAKLALKVTSPAVNVETPKEKTPDETFDELFTSHFRLNEGGKE